MQGTNKQKWSLETSAQALACNVAQALDWKSPDSHA